MQTLSKHTVLQKTHKDTVSLTIRHYLSNNFTIPNPEYLKNEVEKHRIQIEDEDLEIDFIAIPIMQNGLICNIFAIKKTGNVWVCLESNSITDLPKQFHMMFARD
ncbi:MAG TPA: hypothetical protein PJ997_00055 [Candidatus Paceibacterota bacterium]|nr:hypothetical protein [Candidatus Paceibacterota bacterium]HMP18723.1 hypothetical protein [Candidatus Paceibacterota bacterium]HMP85589.1 hypothetical protein [Candidatus Paceibacterota bacterium]